MTQITYSSQEFNVKEFVVNKKNGVKGLTDYYKSLNTLPSPYIQPFQERLTSQKLITLPVPLIDVSNWLDPSVAAKICKAAATLGLFQIVNHGISIEKLEGMVAAARGFFELPVEERRRYWRGSSVSETAWLTTSFSPCNESVLEWRDFLKFEYVPQQHGFSDMWPLICKEQVTEHFKSIKQITNNILHILLNNLTSNPNKINQELFLGTTRMNFNYYPQCPDPTLALGTGHHSDINTLTLLLQEHGLTGLYARAAENEDKWFHVPPVQGAIVVNIGDVLQILSNDRYKSVEHCVMVNKFNSRVSVPVFVGPVFDSVIEPLPEVLTVNEKVKYKRILYKDYVKDFFGRPHDGKTTIESIKIL